MKFPYFQMAYERNNEIVIEINHCLAYRKFAKCVSTSLHLIGSQIYWKFSKPNMVVVVALMCCWLITLICFSLFDLLFTAFLNTNFFSLWETTQTLFWASFGLIDLDNFELAGIKEFTRFWGLSMFGSFSVINIIVLLNLLIAMMNHSYQLISVSSVSFRTMFFLILPHVQQQSYRGLVL